MNNINVRHILTYSESICLLSLSTAYQSKAGRERSVFSLYP